jgi:signal transduction histidine kinase
LRNPTSALKARAPLLAKWHLASAGAVLLLLASAGRGDAEVRKVVLLQSFDRGNLVLDRFTSMLRVTIDERAAEPVTFTEFVVNPAGFRDIPEEAFIEFLESAFLGRPKPDLVITTGGPAADFARRNRHRLFADSPLLYAAVDARFLQNATLAENETAVAVNNDPALIIEDILRLFPDTENVFLVMGSGELGRFWREQFERESARFRRLRLLWADGMSYGQILQRASTLPPRSAIYFLSLDVDAQGTSYSTERVLTDLRARANAPVFGAQSAELGHGLIGGTLMSIETASQNTADAALRILAGTSPALIKTPLQQPGPPTFDWRELRRWGVSEDRLPPGSEVRFREPSLWRDYRREMLGVLAALLVQALLIAGLLYQRRERYRAEVESRRHLSLAADANRRMTMSALTGSIAHELSQPLNSILHNVTAAEIRMGSAKGASPEVLREILADIRTADARATEIIERHRTMLRTHQLETKPIDIHEVVRESVALTANDTKARQILVDVDLPPVPCVVIGDRVLLQQVVVNLLMNAMDAMSETPAARRRITVRAEIVAQGSVMVSVQDAGTGLPGPLLEKLFEPFVTTKPNGMGIGLTIARTIVEAHGGTIDAHNNAEGGATFAITLPCRGREAAAIN